MTNYLVVDANNKVLLETDYDLELVAEVEEMRFHDEEFTIYEQTRKGDWVEAEFTCYHSQLYVTSHGNWEERCELVSKIPGYCEVHGECF